MLGRLDPARNPGGAAVVNSTEFAALAREAGLVSVTR